MIDIEKDFGPEIQALFEQHNQLDIVDRGFAAPKTINDEGILFVGLNPSYTKPIPGSGYYQLKDGENYKYFHKFEHMAKELNQKFWGHLDVLFLRETSQKVILNFMNTPEGREFAWHNVQITKRILEKSKPKVIIVENTLARVLLGAEKTENDRIWMDYDFTFDDNLGTHRITTEKSNLKGTPVFFTGMFTGQRALDRGSFERLQWHVGKVLAGKSMK